MKLKSSRLSVEIRPDSDKGKIHFILQPSYFILSYDVEQDWQLTFQEAVFWAKPQLLLYVKIIKFLSGILPSNGPLHEVLAFAVKALDGFIPG